MFDDLQKAYHMQRALTLFISKLSDGLPCEDVVIGVLEISQNIAKELERFLSCRSDFKYTGSVEAMVERVNSRP